MFLQRSVTDGRHAEADDPVADAWCTTAAGAAAIDPAVYPDADAFWADLSAAYADAGAAAGRARLHVPAARRHQPGLPQRPRAAGRARGAGRGRRAPARALHPADQRGAGRPARRADASPRTCAAGNFRSSWAAEGGYDFVAEALFGELDVDGFFLEYDDARSGGFEPLRFVPPGKMVVLGLVTTKRGELESKDELKRRIDEAAQFVPTRSAVPVAAVRLLVHGGGQRADATTSRWRSCGWSSRRRPRSGARRGQGSGPRGGAGGGDNHDVQDAGDPLVRLTPVDRAEVTIVMDNFVDLLLAPTEDVGRYLPHDLGDRQQLVAEHGFSALITVERDGQTEHRPVRRRAHSRRLGAQPRRARGPRARSPSDRDLPRPRRSPRRVTGTVRTLRAPAATARHPSRGVAPAQGRPANWGRDPVAAAKPRGPRGGGTGTGGRTASDAASRRHGARVRPSRASDRVRARFPHPFRPGRGPLGA